MNKRIKLGLITFHYANNYGALLQTFATIKFFESIGIDVVLINLIRRPRNRLLSFIYRDLLNRKFKIFMENHLFPISQRKYFADQNLSVLNQDFDGFIVGSDQVWRIENTVAFGYRYFLDFVDNQKIKIAFSSSFGIGTWNQDKNVTNKVKELLSSFNVITVRERSGVNICNTIFDLNATMTIDPVLYFRKTFYEESFLRSKFNLPSKYGVVFFLDKLQPDCRFLIHEKICKKKVINISIKKLTIGNNKWYDIFPKSVEKWLYYISKADFVITESFHCMVFAIIFKKKFVCVVNERRGRTRVESLLELLHLEYLMIERKQFTTEIVQEKLSIDFDKDSVARILNNEIEKSKTIWSDFFNEYSYTDEWK